MITSGRVLLAIDFSDASATARDEAALLARTLGAELDLAHVASSARPDDPEAPLLSHYLDRALGRLAKDLEADGVRVARPFRVAFGEPPAATLVGWLRDGPYGLAVLGAGARTAADQVLLGTTAERVVREAPCPVWLARPSRRRGEVRRILCGVDGSAPAPEPLSAAVQLARAFRAELSLLDVVPARQARVPAGSLHAVHEEAARSAAGFEAAVRAIDLRGVEHALLQRVGKPAVELVDTAGELEIDLLVVGIAGRTGLARVVRDNTAEKVLRQAPCSVLTVPIAAGS